jgi:transcriptional regulator with XRE-family HTH domain
MSQQKSPLELIANDIKLYREENNISQQYLSDDLGLHRNTISRLERKRPISMTTFIKLLNYFEFDLQI